MGNGVRHRHPPSSGGTFRGRAHLTRPANRWTEGKCGDGPDGDGDVKGVGEGVLEYKIDFGPGYRIYFGRQGNQFIILLAGGTKKRQNADIRMAQRRWAEYRRRKAG